MKKGCREGWNSPICSVCTCSFLGASWASCVEGCGYSCSTKIHYLFCGVWVFCVRCWSILQLFCIIFGLAPVNHHPWVRFFWPVTRTDARKGSLHLVSGFHLGLLTWGGVMQVHYIVCMHDTQCMHHVGIISGVFSFCYILMRRKDYHVFILSQHMGPPCLQSTVEGSAGGCSMANSHWSSNIFQDHSASTISAAGSSKRCK